MITIEQAYEEIARRGGVVQRDHGSGGAWQNGKRLVCIGYVPSRDGSMMSVFNDGSVMVTSERGGEVGPIAPGLRFPEIAPDVAEGGQSDYGPGIDYEERRKLANDRLELLIEQVPDVDAPVPIDVE